MRTFLRRLGAFLLFLGTCGLTLCAGHSVGMHRRLIHNSFACPLWLEHACVYLGVLVGMAGPMGMIRIHDMRDWAQRQPDCHPFFGHRAALLRDGWHQLHCELALVAPPRFRLEPRLAQDRVYAFLERTWMAQQLPWALLFLAIGGLPWVVWGVCVRVAACTTMHWGISYFAHTRGPSDWSVDGAVIQAHNVPIMAIPTMGESWHGNHHAFPSSARHGLYPGQIDLGYRFIQLLELLGLAWNVKLPSTLPPRPGITPLTRRALDVAAPGQAEVSTRPAA